MTPRIFDTSIAIKPSARVKSYYSDRWYDATEIDSLHKMAVLEGSQYVFKVGAIAYGVAPEDVEILDG